MAKDSVKVLLKSSGRQTKAPSSIYMAFLYLAIRMIGLAFYNIMYPSAATQLETFIGGDQTNQLVGLCYKVLSVSPKPSLHFHLDSYPKNLA